MKKVLIILPILIILIFGGFILLRKDAVTPIDETVQGGSPFGSGEGVNIPAYSGASTVGVVTPFDESVPAATTVFRISNTPVAGFVALAKASTTFVRYVDRATGHIFDVVLPKAGETAELDKTRITNNTLPKIYEAHFRSDGGAVLLRSLEGAADSVRNMSLTLIAPTATSTASTSLQTTNELYKVAATNLRGDIDSVAAGNGNSLYYSLPSNNSISSSDFTGGSLRTLFTSPFTNWRLGRLGANVLVYTKASVAADGFAYSLTTTGGNLTRVAGPARGLTALGSANGSKLLYSYYENGTTRLVSKTLSNNSLQEILPATLSEKCAWSSKEANSFFCGVPLEDIVGAEPDNWYLGRTHFTDYIWKFDTNSETAELISEPKTEYGLDLDVSEPRLAPNEDFFLFINKRDMTLWAVRI